MSKQNNSQYVYAIAKPGSFDGTDELGASIAVTYSGTTAYQDFSQNHDVAKRVRNGEKIWFRILANAGALGVDFEEVKEEDVPLNIKDPDEYIKDAMNSCF
jgi:hypothetical protein